MSSHCSKYPHCGCPAEIGMKCYQSDVTLDAAKRMFAEAEKGTAEPAPEGVRVWGEKKAPAGQISLEQVQIFETIQKGLEDALKPFVGRPVTQCYNEVLATATRWVEKCLAEYGLHPKVELTAEIKGDDLILKPLDMYSACVMHGFNPRGGKFLVEENKDERFITWTHPGGTLRQNKETREIVFIPPAIAAVVPNINEII